jgi:hypothetical protein
MLFIATTTRALKPSQAGQMRPENDISILRLSAHPSHTIYDVHAALFTVDCETRTCSASPDAAEFLLITW